MRINLKFGSITPKGHQNLIFNTIMELVESYHVGDSDKRHALHFFQSTDEGKNIVADMLKQKYGITATPYKLGEPENIFSEGYEVSEDQYLTKLLLTL